MEDQISTGAIRVRQSTGQHAAIDGVDMIACMGGLQNGSIREG